MTGKNHWLILCIFLFPQLLWGLEDQQAPDAAQYEMALNYAKDYRYKLILEIVEQVPSSHADKDYWLPLQAQAYAARGEVKVADYLFQKFLRVIPEDERRYYEDITLMMSPEEQNTFSSLKEEEQGQFINEFWKKRDPLLSAGANIRKVEHYRRVWYARQFFNGKQPWDRRGEVYIKFGEPDYKFGGSYGGRVPPLAVEFLKERLAYELALNMERAARREQVPEWNTLKRKQRKGALTDPYLSDRSRSRWFAHIPMGIVDLSRYWQRHRNCIYRSLHEWQLGLSAPS